MTSRPNTRLVLHIAGPDGDSLYAIEVQETIDEVINHLIPLQPAASMLDHRTNSTYTRADDGGRVFIHPSAVQVAYEIVPDEDD